jgi:hypothetical protein
MQITPFVLAIASVVSSEVLNDRGQYNTTQQIQVGDVTYKVTMYADGAANLRYNFISLENMDAAGAAAGRVVFDIDGQYKIEVAGAAAGTFLVKNQQVEASGAVSGEVVAFDGTNKVLNAAGAASGILVCDKKTLVCSKIDGAFDGRIKSQWLNFEGAVRVNGQGMIDPNGGRIIFQGGSSINTGRLVECQNQYGKSWCWENTPTPGTPGTPTPGTPGTPTPGTPTPGTPTPGTPTPGSPTPSSSSSSSTRTSTATRTPTKTPETDSASSVGVSALAVVAGLVSFFF